jgi:hypothetical protein
MRGSLLYSGCKSVNLTSTQGSPRDLLGHHERQYRIYGTSTSNFASAPNSLY